MPFRGSVTLIRRIRRITDPGNSVRDSKCRTIGLFHEDRKDLVGMTEQQSPRGSRIPLARDVPSFLLRFEKQRIDHWACRYSYPQEDVIVAEIAPRVRSIGYLSKADFMALCRWKTPRTEPMCDSNDEDFIKEVTNTALSTPNEQLRIEVLTLLRGVGWPTASVILHFGYDNLYPILDYRALWSVGVDEPPSQYSFKFWRAYSQFCRTLAADCCVAMRTLDRALWQYAKEKQGADGTSEATP